MLVIPLNKHTLQQRRQLTEQLFIMCAPLHDPQRNSKYTCNVLIALSITRIDLFATLLSLERFRRTFRKSMLLNEWSVPLATTSPARKRKPDDDDFFLVEHGFSERPTKALKAQGSSDEINPRNGKSYEELTCCVLTVPLWVMQKCTRDNELFCKSDSLLLRIFLLG